MRWQQTIKQPGGGVGCNGGVSTYVQASSRGAFPWLFHSPEGRHTATESDVDKTRARADNDALYSRQALIPARDRC